MMTNNNNNSHNEIGRKRNFMKNIVWSFPESRLTIKREIVGYRQQSFSRLNLHLTITLHVPLTKMFQYKPGSAAWKRANITHSKVCRTVIRTINS